MRTRPLRGILCSLLLGGMVLVGGPRVASAQNTQNLSRTPRTGNNQDQGWSHTRPAERSSTARPQPRSHYTPQAQQAQQQGAAVQQYTYRPYTSGYYYPYTYGYYGGYPYSPYPYYWPGYTVSSGGPYYEYQMPNPYAFGSAVTYGYPTPGGYHYYYPW